MHPLPTEMTLAGLASRGRVLPGSKRKAACPGPAQPQMGWVGMAGLYLLAAVLTQAQAADHGLHAGSVASQPAALAAARDLDERSPDWAQRSRAMERARLAVVGVKVQALEGARSARTLGLERSGSGVVVADDGLVLTIGYLLIEADTVDLSLPDGREVPARVRAVDAATGLGLLQALAPTGLAPVPLAAWPEARPLANATASLTGAPGRTAIPVAEMRDASATGDRVTMVSGGPSGDLHPTQVLGQPPFAGSWEYRLDRALLTHPPLPQHSGAALFNARGELVGIGSLLLQDVSGLLAGATEPPPGALGRRVPGNLFVPADLLPPILAELQAQGRSQASVRAWLGLNCAEDPQGVQVIRVQDDSPADVAGLQAGDRLLRLDGAPVQTLSDLWQRLWAGGTAERAVVLDLLRDGQPLSLTVHSVDRDKTWRRPVGI